MAPVYGTIAPLRRIRSIDFGILSPDEVIKNSVTTGDSNEEAGVHRIEISANGRFVKGGLNDPRMGTVSKSDVCSTCHKKYEDCPGHFGHIHLNAEIFHVGFLDVMYSSMPSFIIIRYRVLSCVCHNCGMCLVPKGDIPDLETMDNAARLDAVFRRSKTVSNCDVKRGGCGHPKVRYRRDG